MSREPSLTSETFHCSSGVNQLFSQTSHVFRPHQFADDDLYYHADRDVLPVVIHCVVEEGTDGSLVLALWPVVVVVES